MVNGTGLVAQIRNTMVIPHSLAIWGLGQMGLIVKAPDAVIYIDPYLSDSVLEATRDQYGAAFQRAFPPPLKPEEATNADYILCTHEHMDHLDVQTIGPMAQASPNAKIVTTGWGVEILTGLGIAAERIIMPEALQPLALPGTSIRLTAVPSAHYEKEFAPNKGYRYLGFLIEWNGVVLYHAGDTVMYPGYLETLRELPTPDVAMVPTNGRDWFRENVLDVVGNLNPAEAALLARELGWDVLIPGHNGLLLPNSLPQTHVVDALEHHAPYQRYKFLQPGELYYYVKAS